MTQHPTLNRRTALLGGVGLLGASQLRATPAMAQGTTTLNAGAQVPGAYRLKVGSLGAAVASDGTVRVEPALPTISPNADPAEVEALLRANMLPTDRVDSHCNLFVLETGSEVVLFDTGTGGLMGPDSGRLLANLAAVGLAPEDVDVVVLSHCHADHVFGVMAADGQPVFPNARYLLDEREARFWLDTPVPSGPTAFLFEGAQRNLAPVRDRITLVRPDDEVVPGVVAVDATGHTPGHLAFEVTSGGDRLLLLNDTANHSVLFFEHPEWHFGFDVDGELAVTTRRRLLDRAAAEGVRVLGYHFPFPGLGHVATAPTGYRYVPEPWSWHPI